MNAAQRGVAVLLAAAWSWYSVPLQQEQAPRVAVTVAIPAANTGATRSPPSLAPRVPAPLLASAPVQIYQDQQAFQQRARAFFTSAPPGTATTRAEAEELAVEVDRRLARGELSAPEALALRIGLVRTSEPDEVRQVERIGAVIASYRAASDARELQWQAQQRTDPQLQAYQWREREIVAEVAAMTRIPGGLDRNEYLRQRLQNERIALAR